MAGARPQGDRSHFDSTQRLLYYDDSLRKRGNRGRAMRQELLIFD